MNNHKIALIVFWTLCGISVTGILMTVVFVSESSDGKALFNGKEMTQDEARILLIMVHTFIPTIILIPLIGSGYFQKEVKPKCS